MLTSTLTAFFDTAMYYDITGSSHPERERDGEAHLNYYASAYNRGWQLLHHKTKLNQIQQNIIINLNYTIQITQNKQNQTKPRFDHLLRSPA